MQNKLRWKTIIQILLRRVRRCLGLDLSYNLDVSITKERHGTEYGGYYVNPTKIQKSSIVYSFGVGEDISFDLSIMKKYGLNLYAFDPTPKSIQWISTQKLPTRFHFFPYGIADFDGITKFYVPKNHRHVSHTMISRYTNQYIRVQMYRLAAIMKKLGHNAIDILKMDIEGAECAVIRDILTTRVKVSQLLVEFHHRFSRKQLVRTNQAIKALKDSGYKIFDISPDGEVYSFALI